MIELRSADAVVAIDPDLGGRLASLAIGGRELLRGPAGPGDRSTMWGCFLMAPWPGRLAGARLRWAGREHQLRQNLGPHGLHGVVFDQAWRTERVAPDEAELACRLDPALWPPRGEVRQRVRLEPGRLTLEAEVVADVAMPAALGWHPWFLRRAADPRVRLDAARVLVAPNGIPDGETAAVGAATDLRRGPRLGDRRLDDAYVDVRSPVGIRWPDLELTMTFGDPLRMVVVFTPPEAFCVEPQTAWPNALGMAPDDAARAGAAFLDPGESLRAALELTWR